MTRGSVLRAGVLGRPIGHSLSPVLHAAAYAALGMSVRYDRHDLGEDEVAGFVRARLGGPGGSGGADSGSRDAPAGDDWLGLSVTMPLKAAVVPCAGERTARVQVLGVANTLVRHHPDHPGVLLADNTDVDGIVRALTASGVHAGARGGTVGVLGNGGTAAAAVLAAHDLGADAVLLGVRDPARAQGTLRLAGSLGLGARAVSPTALATSAPGLRAVVATLPPRAADPVAEVVAADASGGPLPPLLDAAYDPWPSALAEAWERRGGEVASGITMLLHQGVEQVRLFTERPRREAGAPEPDWTAVTAAAAHALGVPSA